MKSHGLFVYFFSGIRFQPESLSQSHQQIQVSVQFSCSNRFAVINILRFASWVVFSSFPCSNGNGCDWMQQERSSIEGSAIGEVVICNDGHCSGTMKRRSIRAVKGAHHKLPEFHEDYSGPRNHKPKHH